MNDEVMKKLKKFEEDLRQPEEELEEIRWLIGRFEYDRAWETVDVFEKTYEKLLQTAEMEEIQCRFWALKLECLTDGFQRMELSRNEEEIATGLFRRLVRMNQLSVRGMRYLFRREEYLRLQKRLDYLEVQKAVKGMFLGATGSLAVLALVLAGVSRYLGILSRPAAGIILVTYGMIWAALLIFELAVYRKTYDRWQDYLRCPVPFEHGELF